MKAAVFLNPDGVRQAVAEELFGTLRRLNIEYTQALAGSEETDCLINGCDVVLALGGDGTILHTAKRAALSGRKILGINCGHLGYTAGLESNELSMLGALKTGEYTVDRRLMLKASVISGGEQQDFYCVNDAVVSKGALARMLSIRAEFSGGTVINYRSDGLIIATPTGSTAYSLSAGGPVVEPSLDSIIVTPICAHSLFNLPLVLNPGSTVEITVGEQTRCEAFLTVDGETAVPIEANSRVSVARAPITADIIKIKKDGFLKTLREKIK